MMQRQPAFVFLTVLGLLFYYLGMTRQRELERYDNRITLIRSDGNAYSCMEAEQMRIRNQEAEDPFSYVLWGKEGICQLQNRDLGRFAETEIYVVEGSSSLLFTSSVILDGTVKKSCLIGDDTAQALFGTDDATGLSITMDGSDYVGPWNADGSREERRISGERFEHECAGQNKYPGIR